VFSQVPHEPRQGLSSRRRFLKRAATAGGAALMGAAGLNEVSPVIWREPTELELKEALRRLLILAMCEVWTAISWSLGMLRCLQLVTCRLEDSLPIFGRYAASPASRLRCR